MMAAKQYLIPKKKLHMLYLTNNDSVLPKNSSKKLNKVIPHKSPSSLESPSKQVSRNNIE
jgi:hypothetical protein